MIELTSLGHCTIRDDGAPIFTPSAHKQKCALLLYLAMEGPVSRDHLLAVFWPEREDEKARHSLSQALYAMRRELPDGSIRVSGDQVSLTPGSFIIDAKRMEEVATEEDWEAASELYQGPFLHQFSLPGARGFEEWQSRTRIQLGRVARRAFRALVEEREAAGDSGGALAAASRWAALEPLEDEAQHTLIALLARSGQRAAALRQFDAYRESLAREMDVEPLDETLELVERIRAGEAPDFRALATTRPAEPPPEARPTPTTTEATTTGVREREGAASTDTGGLSLLKQLRARRLFQVGAAYLAFAALSLDMTNSLTDRGIVPHWVFPTALLLLIAGLPLAVVLAWVEEGSAAAPIKWPRWVEQVRGGHVLAVLGALLIGLIAGRVFLTRDAGQVQPLDAAAGLDPQRIAVLYLDDNSQGGANRHLADAFTEVLIHDLVQIEALTVLPKSAVKPYQNTEVPLDSVAITLRAGTLVEGSLIGTEDWLRVNVQLINAATLTPFKSIMVAGTPLDPRAVLDSLATRVSRILRTELGVEFELRERMAETESDAAWEHVQRAKRLREDALSMVMAADTSAAGRALDSADSLLAHAEKLDTEWLEPIVERGEVALVRARLFSDKPGTYNPEWIGLGIAHADRALEQEPDNAAALELRGYLRYYLFQSADSAAASELLAEAERDLSAAVSVDPSRARAWSRLSRVYLQSGRHAEAKQAAERAYEADPFLAIDLIVIFGLCETALQLQELDQAERWCKEGRRHYPDEPSFVAAELTILAGYVGPDPNVDQAWTLAEALQELSPPQQRPALKPSALYYVAAVLARAGLADSARAVLRQGHAADTLNDPQTAYYEANVRLQLGEEEAALRLLADFLQGLPTERSVVATDWWWRPLQDDPAFKELVATHE